MRAKTIHYAPESDDAGICGLSGYLVETQEHVTCEWCIDRMRAANIMAGRNADGTERRGWLWADGKETRA